MKKSISLKNRVIIIVSAIIGVITIAAIVSSYSIIYNNTLKRVQNIQYRVASFMADIVSEQLNSGKIVVETLARTNDFNESNEELSELLEKIKNINEFTNLSLAFEDGEFIINKSTANAIPKDFDPRTREWFQKGINTNGIYISTPYLDAASQEITLSITYPVIKNGVKGLVNADFTFELNEYLEEMVNKELDGVIFVVHKTGLVTGALDKKFLGHDVSESFSEQLVKAIKDKIDNKVFKYTPPVEYVNAQGINRIASVTSVEGYDYAVAYGVSKTKLIKDISLLSIGISIVILVISLMGVVVLYIMLSKMLNPLGRYAEQIYEMAQNKDLSTKIDITRNDELGSILKAINELNKSTNDIVSEVRSSIIEVASANNELAATMEELSTTFNSQSQQVATMVNGIEGVSSISKNTSDALSSNMDTLEQTAESTSNETEKLDKVSIEMGEIEEDTVTLSETISHLSESSEQISNILGVINDIANQTNLLALNAAIEAARAGEAGRGFAVVADEVRKLAERTQHATKEIEDIINGLLKDSADASVAMDKSVTSVHDGTTNITSVTVEIKKAVNDVVDLYTSMRPVAESVSEQYVTIQSVVDSAQVIAAGLEESNAAVNEVNNTVNHIQQRTDNLKMLIEQFRV